MASIPYCLLVHFIALLAYGVAPARADIIIGAPYPATGPNSWLGSPTKVGIERAVYDQNNSKDRGLLGQRLDVVWENDRCDSDQAATAARKLTNSPKKVAVVIGHQCSGAALSAAPIYNDAQMLLISSFATNPKVTDSDWRLVFRVNGRDDQQSEVAAAFLKKQFENAKIAIVHDTRAYGEGLAKLLLNSLSKVNITPVKFEEIKPDALPSQYSDVVRRMRNAGVEVIYYAGYSDVGGNLRKLSWEEGLHVPMLAGDGILSEDYWTNAGPEAAGMILTTNAPDPRNREEAAEVVAAIHEQGKPVFPQTLHAYAAVQAWVQAVKMAGTTQGDKVATALRTGTFDTVIGRIGFNEKGDLTGPKNFFVWYTWRNGSYVELDPTGWKRQGIVCSIQAGLNALGLNSGPTDGIVGPRTRRALMKFLPEKTVVNFDTINQLLVADIKADVKKKFADRNHPWTEYELVCRAQAGLNALGFSPGSVNGKNNRRTQEAIRRFVDVWKKDRTISDIRIIVDDIESAVDAIDPNLGEWPMTQGDGVHP